MNRSEIIPSIVLSAHALARIAAQDAGNEAPSAQWRVLSLLEEHGAIRVGALATAARTTQPGMTRLIGELDRAGLVSRSSDPSDSRATVVEITAAGRDAVTGWRAEFRETLLPRFADLGESDWEALSTAARILASHSARAPHAQTGDSE